MKKQKLILPIAILLAVTLSILVIATSDTRIGGPAPVSFGNYTTVTFNCTTNVTGCDECLNATIFYTSTNGGQAIAGTALCTVTNDTEDDYEFLSTDNSACATAFEALTDGVLYNFTCSFNNASDTSSVINATNAIHNITVDNTIPSISVSTDYSEINLHRIFQYTTSVSDATSGLDTWDCNVTTAGDEVFNISTTSTSDEEFSNTGEVGNYDVNCTATDLASNTAAGSARVKVKSSGASVKSKKGISISGLSGIFDKLKSLDQKTQLIIGVIVVILLIARAKKK